MARPNETLTAFLRSVRLGRELTQGQIATAVGVSRRTIVSWERGETSPPLDHVERWVEALQLTEWERAHAAALVLPAGGGAR